MFKRSLKSKLKRIKRKGDYKSFFADKILFKKIRNLLGGRIHMMVTASAPIKKEVKEFF